MLTEEMLAALIQALKGVHRLSVVIRASSRRLARAAVVDIVKHLTPEGVTEKFPRVGPGYANDIRRRQAGETARTCSRRMVQWFTHCAG